MCRSTAAFLASGRRLAGAGTRSRVGLSRLAPQPRWPVAETGHSAHLLSGHVGRAEATLPRGARPRRMGREPRRGHHPGVPDAGASEALGHCACGGCNRGRRGGWVHGPGLSGRAWSAAPERTSVALQTGRRARVWFRPDQDGSFLHETARPGDFEPEVCGHTPRLGCQLEAVLACSGQGPPHRPTTKVPNRLQPGAVRFELESAPPTPLRPARRASQ